VPIRLTSDRTSLGRPNNPGRRSLLLKGEPCSGVTHQTYDYTDGKPIDPRDFSNFGGAKGSRTPDLLNAILKTSNSLSFLVFPRRSKIPL
jgi:hypothetical protein